MSGMAYLNCIVALLLVFLAIPHGQCITLDDLYPFGVEEGDTVLEAPVTNLNGSLSVASASIPNITVPFVLHGNSFTFIQVSAILYVTDHRVCVHVLSCMWYL